MRIDVDVAVFGEKGTEHGLIKSTAASLPSGLIAKTDLPVGLDGLVPSHPLLAGFPLDDRYVFLSTLPDPNSKREGMARTVACLTAIESICSCEDLRPLVRRLNDLLTGDAAAELFSINCDVGGQLGDKVNANSLAVFEALVSGDSNRPLVWNGLEHFGDLLPDLWRMLPLKMRASFAFRTACRPPSESSQDAHLICVPSQRIARWSSFRIVSASSGDAEQFDETRSLLNHATRNSIYNFASELGLSLDSLHQLPTVARCFSSFVNLESGNDHDVTTVFRWITKLSPEPKTGLKIKQKVLEALTSRIRVGDLNTIGYVRNLSVDAFQGGMKEVADACEYSVNQLLTEPRAELTQLIREAFESTQLAWSKGTLRATAKSVSECVPTAVQIFAHLLGDIAQPKVRTWLEQVSALSSAFEDSLIQHASDLVKLNASSELLNLCQRRDWSRLHALVGSVLLAPPELLRRQAAFQTDLSSVAKEVASLIGDANFVETAISLNVNEYWQQVAACCDCDASLLERFDVMIPAWRHVFCMLVDRGNQFSGSYTTFEAKISAAWQALATGGIEDDNFIRALSKSRFANVLDLPSRENIWVKLDGEARDNVLEATAAAWFAQPEPITEKVKQLEVALRSEVLSERNRTQLLPAKEQSDLLSAISTFDAFTELGENDFAKFRNRFLSENLELSEAVARRLGEYIQLRDWGLLAVAVLNDFRRLNRTDLLPALLACRNQFGWLTRARYRLNVSQIPDDEWWNEAINVLCEAYPSGPMENGLWTRANGDRWEIQTNGSGKENWTHAIGLLKRSRNSTALQIDGLLWQASEDADGDSEIAALIEHCPFDLNVSRHEPFLD